MGTHGFYVARYFHFAYNKPKTFIDVKKLPSSKGLSQLNIFFVKKRHITATTVQSDVIATLTETTYCLNTLTNIACVVGVNGEMVGFRWQKAQGRRERNAPYPDKEIVSNKQPSLISSTSEIQRSQKGRYAHINT